jgi:hypothetical protein
MSWLRNQRQRLRAPQTVLAVLSAILLALGILIGAANLAITSLRNYYYLQDFLSKHPRMTHAIQGNLSNWLLAAGLAGLVLLIIILRKLPAESSPPEPLPPAQLSALTTQAPSISDQLPGELFAAPPDQVAASDPRALRDYLASLPLLKRADAERQLIRLRVTWEGELQGVTRKEIDKAEVAVWFDAGRSYFTATVGRTLGVDMLREGDRIKIAGSISLLGPPCMHLDNARVIF